MDKVPFNGKRNNYFLGLKMQMTTDNLTTNTLSATYSPEDNKLRLYSLTRLPKDLYERVREAGFIYAPKQDLFVAPMWTPNRADLLIELCGEIGDEDTTLVDRATERAERFGEYQENRLQDATSARASVEAITQHIPFGQPILVGHHSERRARKDAERIESNMRKAVQMWDQSEYWKRRAAGAVAHAKYKERPDVRARRIKTIEADKRKAERERDDSAKLLKLWSAEGLTLDRAKAIANYDHCSRCYPLADFPRNPPASQYEGMMGLWSALEGSVITAEQARDIATPHHTRVIAGCDRWIAHYDNRIAYERAMLDEQGGLVAESVEMAVGGQILSRGEWLTIMRITKKDGKAVSVSTNARFSRVRAIEEITEYKAPAPEVAQAVAAATKLAPLCNFPGEGVIEITKAEWDKVPKDYRGTNKVKATDTVGAHRVRSALGSFVLKGAADMNQRHKYHAIFVTDEKRKDPPAIAAQVEAAPVAQIPAPMPDITEARPAYQPRQPNEFDAMRDQLKTGAVQVVSAPQLFPTPPAVAARMVEAAQIDAGHRILEPEAGTGAIIREIARTVSLDEIELHAVEVNAKLAANLRAVYPAAVVTNDDFLQYRPTAGTPLFDRILMNPPFADGQDIKHILYARALLAPGGRLVAICANGSRQNATLKPLVESIGGTWEVLPAGSFESSGTGVSTVMLVIDAE